MKLKYQLIVAALHIFIFNSNAQILVKTGGRVGIGTNDVSSAKVTINAENTNLNGLLILNNDVDWSYNSSSNVTSQFAKSWVVNRNGNDNFYVCGEGSIWSQLGNYTISDSTLKCEIKQIDSALQKIQKLKGVYYKLKNEKENAVNNQYVGLIAQEVELVVPEAVKTNNKGQKAVAYSNLVGLLIEAIKSQNRRIDELNNTIKVNEYQNKTQSDSIKSLFYKSNSSEKDNQENKNDLNTNINGVLYQNTPNPAKESTIISFELPLKAQNANLYIYNLQGEQLRVYSIINKNENKILIRSNEYKAGIYYYSLIVDGKEIGTKKMILTE